MKILHVITTLAQGGAEAVLFRLIVASTPALEHVVISMRGDAYYASKLRAAGYRGVIKRFLAVRRYITAAGPRPCTDVKLLRRSRIYGKKKIVLCIGNVSVKSAENATSRQRT